MLNNWMKHSPRTRDSKYEFFVYDVDEVCDPNLIIKEYLCSNFKSALFPEGFLEICASDLGWDYVNNEVVNPKLATTEKLKRGEFGEMLTALCANIP
jgi:hypothetical protein